MMVQVVVKIDKDLKERCIKKLKKQGLTLSQFFRAVSYALVEGALEIQLVQKKPFSLRKYIK